MPIFNEDAKRIVRDGGDIGRRSPGEIDVAVPRDRAIKARYRGRGAQHRREQKEPGEFHSALRHEPGSIRPARESQSVAKP